MRDDGRRHRGRPSAPGGDRVPQGWASTAGPGCAAPGVRVPASGEPEARRAAQEVALGGMGTDLVQAGELVLKHTVW